MQICASTVAGMRKAYCGYFPDLHEIENEADLRSKILVWRVMGVDIRRS